MLMNKLYQTLRLALLAVLVAFTGNVVAQRALPLPQVKMARNISEFVSSNDVHRRYPALFQQGGFGQQNAFRTANQNAMGPKTSPQRVKLAATTDGRTIWGVVIASNKWSQYSSEYGVYSFQAKDGTTLNSIAQDYGMDANGGGAFYDNSLHLINYYSFWGMSLAQYYEYDMSSWSQTRASSASGLTLAATAATYDATTGLVYGCFSDYDGYGHELGAADYSALTRTTLRRTDTTYVSMAASPQGVIYALDGNGNLSTMNKTTGAMTKVGSTGLSLSSKTQGAVWDDKSGQIYLAACLTDGTSGLYTINPATAAATKVSSFPNNEQISILYIPFTPEDGAPAKVTNLSASFPNGGMDGTVTFTLPTTTYKGSTLSGDLNYSIKIGGKELKIGTAKAGAKVTETVTSQKDGDVKVEVVASNNAGNSESEYTSVYIGYGTPNQARNVDAKVDVDTRIVNLKWMRPDSTDTKGWMGGLHYRVVRSDGKVVTESTPDTTATDTLPEGEWTGYYYNVYTSNGNKQAEYSTKSNYVAAGSPIVPPIFEDFNTEADFAKYTVYNRTDGEYGSTSGWRWSNNAAVSSSGYGQNNEWLITPLLSLKSDRSYTVSFKARCGDTNKGMYHSTMEVKWGEGSDTATYATLMPVTNLMKDSYTEFTYKVTPAHDGNYRIGFHDVTPSNQYNLYLDSISVVPGAVFDAPDSVTNFEVNAAPLGVLKADISFTLPTKTVRGNELTSITKTEILRNDSVIATFSGKAPGARITFTDDKNITSALYTYTVKAYNEVGEGQVATKTVYVGFDAPGAVQNLRLIDNYDGTATATWDEPTHVGKHGGYADLSNLKYEVSAQSSTSTLGYTDSLTTRSYTFSGVDQTSYNQDFVYAFVTASNKNGGGQYTQSPEIMVGRNIDFPFTESFRYGGQEHYGWSSTKMNGSQFGTLYGYDYDGDNGAAIYTPGKLGDHSTLKSPKISLSGATKPGLVFHYMMVRDSAEVLKVMVDCGDGKVDTLSTIDARQLTGDKGAVWRGVTIPLDKYVGKPYIRVYFDAWMGVNLNILVDAIEVKNLNDYDLIAKSITAPKTVKCNEPATFDVVVSNNGAKTAKNYTVDFLVENKVKETQTGDSISAGDKTTFHFTITPTIKDYEYLHMKARVHLDGDADASNDVTREVQVHVEQPYYNKVTDLHYDGYVKNGTKMAWSAPDSTGRKVEESFESYEPFRIGSAIGPWKTVDADGQTTVGIQGVSFPGMFKKNSFMVFNPDSLGINTEETEALAAHTGKQYLTEWAAENGGNDDWLISPELSGAAQDITFYIRELTSERGYENYQVLASKTGTDIKDFTDTVSTGDAYDYWSQKTVSLPEGTKHFAIRGVTKKGFCMMIDDVNFRGSNLKITGYNVYRNDTLIATVPATQTTYEDIFKFSGTYVCRYNVTVLYEDGGESGYSNPYNISLLIDGIDRVEAEQKLREGPVYNLMGQRVNTLRKGEVYISNGKKFYVK